MKCHPVIIRLSDPQAVSMCRNYLLGNNFVENKDFVFVSTKEEIEERLHLTSEFYPQRLVLLQPFRYDIVGTLQFSTAIKKASTSNQVMYISARQMHPAGIIQGFFKEKYTGNLLADISYEIYAHLNASLPAMSIAA